MAEIDIKKLREDYKDLTGGNPFNGWSADKLLEKMAEYKEEHNIVEVEVSAMPRPPAVQDIKEEKGEASTHLSRHQKNQKLVRMQVYKQLMKVEMIFIKGKPMAILNDQYVDWEEAQLIGLKKIKSEIEDLIAEKEQKTAVINS
ncbi:hypothetical protein KAR91_16360 [Candidatus Pacearchaeota archaeon]|nr:hypothetical protein [Candidatus Pacearchaeota archaeon]